MNTVDTLAIGADRSAKSTSLVGLSTLLGGLLGCDCPSPLGRVGGRQRRADGLDHARLRADRYGFNGLGSVGLDDGLPLVLGVRVAFLNLGPRRVRGVHAPTNQMEALRAIRVHPYGVA